MANAARKNSLLRVVTQALLSQASIYRNREQLEEAQAKLEEARLYGADITAMQTALLDDISKARK